MIFTCKLVRTLSISAVTVAILCSCSTPETSPDKTLSGAVLGAAWGAGAGAVIGNQVHGNVGPGLAVGAGFGAVSGALAGAGADVIEARQGELEDALASLKIQNAVTQSELSDLQTTLDRATTRDIPPAVYTVNFGDDETDPRSGAISTLQTIADALKSSPRAARIVVSGHTDDTGNPEYNQKVSEARARSVAGYLAARGISMDQIEVKAFGSSRPVASNATPEGRQLNRRVEVYIAR